MAVNYGQVAIVPKGAWNAETQYKVNNLVSYDGSSYVAKVQPPVGTLPTDTSYWQVSAAGTKKATADSLGTVMPDGTTTSVGEDGKLSVNTAQQDALGVVKGSDDITVGEDGTLTVNTTFEQATELANIIAGEAIKSVLGKVSKAIATTMSLDENALLKNMISGIDVNDSNKVPSSAYIHTLADRIGMGTELVSGLGDLTTGLNTVNNNLSKSRETVRTPTNITTGTNILKLDPGIYSYEDSNASDEQKLAMGFPKAMWHSEITVTGYWADNNKSTGYINIVVRDCNGDTPCIYENLYGWTGWRGWQSYALKSDSLRLSRTYISGASYADAKNLSIPPGIYSVGPDYKNIPETTYGFLEIVADSINNWRLIKFIPTNIKSYYLMFYNGYDKTWSGWAHFTSVS